MSSILKNTPYVHEVVRGVGCRRAGGESQAVILHF
jgi:hypothetical protein